MTEEPIMAGDRAGKEKDTTVEPRVGVYVCHCGGNISDQVDVEEVCDKLKKVPGVVAAKSNMFMCSDPGQELIIEDIRSGAVERVVVASYAPSLHEATFRSAIARAGGNPYIYEHANIREQVSWVHHGAAATQKAIRLVAAATAKARQLKPLDPIRVDSLKHATVVGGGIAGLKAARDLAQRGIPVTLIEKSPFLGGRTAHLDRLAPTGERAADIVAALAREVLDHKLITVHTCARITQYQGYIGNFKIGVRREPPAPGEDHREITGVSRSGEFIPFVGIYAERVPETVEEFSLDTGVIILATGFRPYRPRRGEYGSEEFGEVITLPELIRLLAEERNRGRYLELNGRRIKSVALVHCVGSRMIPGIHEEDEEGKLNEYCSRTCCAATLQAANFIRRTYPGTDVFEFYRDIRTYGRGQEELYLEAADNGVTFFRFRADEPPAVARNGGGDGYPLLINVKDQLTFGEEMEVPVDLVVLAVGMEPSNVSDLVELMKLPVGEDRFLQEVHPKLRPVELAIAGVLLAGTCQAPMDVGEACAAASAAAVKASAVLTRGYVELDPFVAEVDLEKCQGTGECVAACRREGALSLAETLVEGEPVLRAQVNPALCLGCGACVAVCPEGAIDVKGWTLGQYEAMVDAIVSDEILD
jgi:heterodisulfide reductase subunit A